MAANKDDKKEKKEKPEQASSEKKEKFVDKSKPKTKQPVVEEKKKIRARNIVRIMGADLDSTFSIYNALRHVKGIGFRTSSAILTSAGIDHNIKLADISPEQIKNIEKAVADARIPAWMKNGNDRQMIMGDVELKRRNDINLLQKMRVYRGIRHELGQPVRGQRTRSSFRKNKTVGVVKKKALAARTGKKE